MKKITCLLLLLPCLAFSQSATDFIMNVSMPNPVCEPNGCFDLVANYTPIKETTSYTVSGIPYIIAYSLTNNIFVADDTYNKISFPFTFCFYGNHYSSVNIGANGVLNFDDTIIDGAFCPYAYTTTIPNTSFPIKNAIYGVYQDINPDNVFSPSRSIKYGIFGIAPNRKVVVQYINQPHYLSANCTDLQTYEIILHETTNIIDIHVTKRTSCPNFNSGVGLIGIQNNDGTAAVVPPGRNTGTWNIQNESWRFTPSGNEVTPQFSWTKDGNVIGNTNPFTFCGDGSMTGNEVFSGVATITGCNGETATAAANSPYNPFVPIPSLGEPSNLALCNQTAPPYVIDLTPNIITALGIESPVDFEIGYYYTLQDAQNGANVISNPNNYSFMANQTVYMRIDNSITGCSYIKSFQIEAYEALSPPLGITPQNFTPGQTLADLVVVGTNILWYDAPIDGNLLPSTTLLVENTTYYASQTNSGGCESKRAGNNRLAITASNQLSTIDFSNSNFIVYPNPTRNNLTITSISAVELIEVYNTIGQQIMNKLSNANNVTVDLSNVSSGVYFLKVTSNQKSQTIKIIKE